MQISGFSGRTGRSYATRPTLINHWELNDNSLLTEAMLSDWRELKSIIFLQAEWLLFPCLPSLEVSICEPVILNTLKERIEGCRNTEAMHQAHRRRKIGSRMRLSSGEWEGTIRDNLRNIFRGSAGPKVWDERAWWMLATTTGILYSQRSTRMCGTGSMRLESRGGAWRAFRDRTSDFILGPEVGHFRGT